MKSPARRHLRRVPQNFGYTSSALLGRRPPEIDLPSDDGQAIGSLVAAFTLDPTQVRPTPVGDCAESGVCTITVRAEVVVQACPGGGDVGRRRLIVRTGAAKTEDCRYCGGSLTHGRRPCGRPAGCGFLGALRCACHGSGALARRPLTPSWSLPRSKLIRGQWRRAEVSESRLPIA
jgi:hypothetical protein